MFILLVILFYLVKFFLWGNRPVVFEFHSYLLKFTTERFIRATKKPNSEPTTTKKQTSLLGLTFTKMFAFYLW